MTSLLPPLSPTDLHKALSIGVKANSPLNLSVVLFPKMPGSIDETLQLAIPYIGRGSRLDFGFA